MPDLIDPRSSAEYQNRLARHAFEAFEESYRLHMTNYMQAGYLPGQEPVSREEELRMLLDRAEGNMALIADENVPPEEKAVAMDDLLRMEELRGATNGRQT